MSAKGDIHPPELWDETIAVNLSGTFHLSRLAAKHLISVPREEGPDGERGVILMVSSTVAVSHFPLQQCIDRSVSVRRAIRPSSLCCVQRRYRIYDPSSGEGYVPIRYPRRHHSSWAIRDSVDRSIQWRDVAQTSFQGVAIS